MGVEVSDIKTACKRQIDLGPQLRRHRIEVRVARMADFRIEDMVNAKPKKWTTDCGVATLIDGSINYPLGLE